MGTIRPGGELELCGAATCAAIAAATAIGPVEVIRSARRSPEHPGRLPYGAEHPSFRDSRALSVVLRRLRWSHKGTRASGFEANREN